MKKLIILIVLAALAGAIFWYIGGFPPRNCMHEPDCVPAPLPKEEDELPSFGMSKISRVILTLDDSGKKTVEAARKSDGRLSAEFKTEDTPVAGSVLILEEHALYREAADDAFIPYIVNYGGSGLFVSVGLFTRKGDTTLELKDSRPIGDRVIITELVLDEDAEPVNLYVQFLDRKEGESFAATPTVPKEAMLPVGNHLFEVPVMFR